MLLKPVALILVFAVVGHLALPAPEKSSYVSASGYGPDGYKYASDPHSVYVSGPGYYAGASATTNGARASVPNFPFFQPFQPFVPFTAYPYNFQYPFDSMQNYFNNLQQSILAAANSGNGYLFQGPQGTQIWASGSGGKPHVTVYTSAQGNPVTVYTVELQSTKVEPGKDEPVLAISKPGLVAEIPEHAEPVQKIDGTKGVAEESVPVEKEPSNNDGYVEDMIGEDGTAF